MESNRRNFLKLAGWSTLALGAKPVMAVFAGKPAPKPVAAVKKSERALTAKHWGLVIDTRQFASAADLEPLVKACHSIHNVPELENKNHEIKWIWEEKFQHAFPAKEHKFVAERIKQLPFLVLCNHCEDPPCVRVCPTKATFKRNDGIVLMDFHRCIGCRFCMAACPYGSRSFNFRDPRPFIKKQNIEFPTRMKGVVEKCNFCVHLVDKGKQPACVSACEKQGKGGMVFGDLKNPDSDISRYLKKFPVKRLRVDLGLEPKVFYRGI